MSLMPTRAQREESMRSSIASLSEINDALKSELARVTAELEQATRGRSAVEEELLFHATRAEAEVRRLREALVEFADAFDAVDPLPSKHDIPLPGHSTEHGDNWQRLCNAYDAALAAVAAPPQPEPQPWKPAVGDVVEADDIEGVPQRVTLVMRSGTSWVYSDGTDFPESDMLDLYRSGALRVVERAEATEVGDGK